MLDTSPQEQLARSVEEVARTTPRRGGDDGSLLEVLRVLWQSRQMVVGLSVLGALGGVAVALLSPTVYRASTAVVASAQIEANGGVGGVGALAGAARQLGLAVGGGGSDPSALFVPILQSRRLAQAVLTSSYPRPAGDSGTLQDYLVPDGEPGPARTEAAIRTFRRDVLRTSLSLESGVLTVSVLLEDPALAAAVATRSVEMLEAINRESRNAQASRWVEFIAGRLLEAENELRGAEENLQTFREQNRSVLDSPKLQLEQARHLREVEIAQEIFTTVKTQHELAKVEQMKNVPVLAVLDPAVTPVQRYRPRRTLIAAAGWLVGLALGAGLVLSRRFLTLLKSSPVPVS